MYGRYKTRGIYPTVRASVSTGSMYKTTMYTGTRIDYSMQPAPQPNHTMLTLVQIESVPYLVTSCPGRR